jgi:hypothetical protein
VRYAVAPQFIRYQPPGFASLTFQQPMKEAFGCTLIATGLDKISITSPSWSTARQRYYR